MLERVHEHGIRHGDLHEGNTLVTARDAVFLLDFGACDLDPNDWDLAEEQRDFTYLLSLRPQVRRPVCVAQLPINSIHARSYFSSVCWCGTQLCTASCQEGQAVNSFTADRTLCCGKQEPNAAPGCLCRLMLRSQHRPERSFSAPRRQASSCERTAERRALETEALGSSALYHPDSMMHCTDAEMPVSTRLSYGDRAA